MLRLAWPAYTNEAIFLFHATTLVFFSGFPAFQQRGDALYYANYFADAVGAIAEAADHHPALTVEWGKVTVRWWTHVIGGLHRNDTVMAARTDTAFANLD